MTSPDDMPPDLSNGFVGFSCMIDEPYPDLALAEGNENGLKVCFQDNYSPSLIPALHSLLPHYYINQELLVSSLTFVYNTRSPCTHIFSCSRRPR